MKSIFRAYIVQSAFSPVQLPPLRLHPQGLAIVGSKVDRDLLAAASAAPVSPQFEQAMSALSDFRQERGE